MWQQADQYNQGQDNERIRVPGGWQTPFAREGMRRLFSKFKSQGEFKEFATYEDWEKHTYKDDPIFNEKV